MLIFVNISSSKLGNFCGISQWSLCIPRQIVFSDQEDWMTTMALFSQSICHLNIQGNWMILASCWEQKGTLRIRLDKRTYWMAWHALGLCFYNGDLDIYFGWPWDFHFILILNEVATQCESFSNLKKIKNKREKSKKINYY